MEIDPLSCLGCGETLDAATCIENQDATPQEGDASICLYCGHLQIFDNNKFRNPTDEDLEDMDLVALSRVTKFTKLYKEIKDG